MLRVIMCLAVALSTGLLASPAGAQTAAAKPKVSDRIAVTDSAKDIEILVAKLLKDAFRLESSLKLVNDNPDDLRLQIPMEADEERGIPRLVGVVDTAVVARDKDGVAISQSINIAAAADLKFSKEQIPRLLQWANGWNARMFPIRVFIADNRVFTGTAILGTTAKPNSSDQIVDGFLGVVRIWSAVIRELKANKLLPDKD